MSTEELSDRICALLLELSAGTCSITDEMIEEETDENTAAILTGLTLLWEDLQYQGRRRTAAEQELRQREARFRALFNQAKVPIWDCDLGPLIDALGTAGDDLAAVFGSGERIRELFGLLQVHTVNHETLRLFGAEDIDAFRKGLPQMVAGDESLPLLKGLLESLARGERRVELPGVVSTLDGKRKHVVLNVNDASVVTDEARQAIVTMADVTAQFKAREAAQELASVRADELRRVSSEVERLFHAVSHDLRAPLRGVINLAEFAHEDLAAGDTDEVVKHLDMLTARITRLETMLTDLLNYARLGRATESVDTVDVGELVDEVRESLVVVPDGFVIERGPMPVIETHETLLGQVFLNLVSNALKHHDKQAGKVTVTHAVGEDGVHVFAVSDDGPGIPTEFRKKIFNMFSTLKPRDEVEGSGMGLAFVHKVVRRNGGTIKVEDNAAGGATFRFTWPLAAAREDASANG